MGGKFDSALEKNRLPERVGDVQLKYETTMLVGRADRADRGVLAKAALVVGTAFGLGTLWAILVRADHQMLLSFLLPAIAAFSAAAWLEQRERRQRSFAVDFVGHVLRLDFSTPITGMPRTLRIPFDSVSDLAMAELPGGGQALTVDFLAGEALFREVLAAHVKPAEREVAERLRKLLRAAVGLEKPAGEAAEPEPDPGPIDTFG